MTKIFNVVRFASQFSIPDDLDQIPDDLDIEDRWILSEFSEMMQKSEKSWENIDIYSASQGLKNFGTGVFPSHWLEMAKSRLYDGDTKAAWTIHRIVRDYLQAFSPICPFFTHYLSTTLYGESAVDACSFPKIIEIDDKLLSSTESIMNFNSKVWKTKKERGISLNSEIQGIKIPVELEDFSVQLKNMHKLSS